MLPLFGSGQFVGLEYLLMVTSISNGALSPGPISLGSAYAEPVPTTALLLSYNVAIILTELIAIWTIVLYFTYNMIESDLSTYELVEDSLDVCICSHARTLIIGIVITE